MTLRSWFRIKTPWRNHPSNQNIIAGLILCLLPGIYLALTGLGAGGGKSSSEKVASYDNAILYGVFALTACCGVPVMNFLGPKRTMSLSAIGYMLYTGGLWYFDASGKTGLAYAGGALEGLCAGLLWASAGAMAYSYAEEQRKALYVTIQWIFCIGGSTIAAGITFAIDFHSEDERAGAPRSVYGVLLGLQGLSIVVSLLLLINPSEVLRSDGQKLVKSFDSSLTDEISGICQIMKERRFLLLIPAILCGEISLALQTSLNAYFNIRTRSLNSFLFGLIQIPASLAITWILDGSCVSCRKSRSLMGISIVAFFTLAVCSGQTIWLVRHNLDRRGQGPSTDWNDADFGGAFVIYMFYGLVYGTFQMATQYVLSSFTNEPLKLARYSGAFRSLNALGMMASFLIDGFAVGYAYQMAFQFACYFLGICSLFVVVGIYMATTNYSDEPNVIPPQHIQENLDEDIAL